MHTTPLLHLWLCLLRERGVGRTSKVAAFLEDKVREESSGEYLKGRWREVNGLRRKAEEDVAAAMIDTQREREMLLASSFGVGYKRH